MNTNYGRLAVTMISSTNALRKYTDSDGGVYIDINKTGDGNYIPSSFFDLSQVAYIRVSMRVKTSEISASDIANVSITADKIMN